MSAEANKAKVRRYFEDALGKGDLSVMDDLVAPDEIAHPYASDLYRGGGPEAAKEFVKAMHDTFANMQFTVDAQIAEGDLVMTRWSARATQQGPLLGIPSTGEDVELTGLIVHRFRDGKSVETWGEWDRLGFLEQVGAFPLAREAGA